MVQEDESIISRLPIDVFVQVLQVYVRGCITQHASQDPHEWTKILLISRHWRDVALQTPVLWSTLIILYGTRVDFVKLFLKRSQNTPLTVRSDFAISLETLQILMKEFHRLRSIDLSFDEEMLGNFPSVVERSAPFLLAVTFRNHSDAEHAQVPIPFLQVEFPSIRHVSIDHFSINAPSTLWAPTLTSLHISGDPESQPPLTLIIAILSGLPNLEDLTLKNFIHNFNLAQAAVALPLTTTSVTLPRLRHLHLYAFTLECSYLLERLVIPAHASVDVEVIDDPDDVRGSMNIPIDILSATLVPQLSGRNRTGAVPHFRTCILKHQQRLARDMGGMYYTEEITFILRSELLSSADLRVPSLSTPLFQLCIWGVGRDDVRDKVKQMFSSFPLQHVETLVVDTRPRGGISCRFLDSGLASMLSATPNVTTMCISDGEAPILGPEHLEEMLTSPAFTPSHGSTRSTSSPSSPREGGGPILGYILPQLKTLTLERIQFKTDAGKPDLTSGLLEILRRRDEAGCSLEKLTLGQCLNVEQADVDELATMVPAVEWDRRGTDEDSATA